MDLAETILIEGAVFLIALGIYRTWRFVIRISKSNAPHASSENDT